MTSLIFTGRVTPDKDVNGLPVMKALMVREGAESIRAAFKSGARDVRSRNGAPMDLTAVEKRIKELENNPEQAKTVEELKKAQASLVRHKAGLAVG